MNATVQQTIDELRRTLTEYLEATYHVGHPAIIAQRRRLLERVGGIFQVPYLESTPRYVTGERYERMTALPEAAREALVRLSNADDGKPVIFNPPYIHQAEALEEILARATESDGHDGNGFGQNRVLPAPHFGKTRDRGKNGAAGVSGPQRDARNRALPDERAGQ